jgi:hypothetical protein
MQLRNDRIIYSGAIKVHCANSQEEIAPHPPVGWKEHSSEGFREDDWILPTSINIMRHNHGTNGADGAYFRFKQDAWYTVFGFALTAEPTIVKVRHFILIAKDALMFTL